MSDATITSLSYELGDISMSFRDVPNHKDIFESNNYPDMPELFGWGEYRKTDRDIFDLGIASALATLREASVKPEDIDLVYFCSTCFPGNEIEHIGFNVRFLSELGLVNAFPVGITLNNCVSF